MRSSLCFVSGFFVRILLFPLVSTQFFHASLHTWVHIQSLINKGVFKHERYMRKAKRGVKRAHPLEKPSVIPENWCFHCSSDYIPFQQEAENQWSDVQRAQLVFLWQVCQKSQYLNDDKLSASTEVWFSFIYKCIKQIVPKVLKLLCKGTVKYKSIDKGLSWWNLLWH